MLLWGIISHSTFVSRFLRSPKRWLRYTCTPLIQTTTTSGAPVITPQYPPLLTVFTALPSCSERWYYDTNTPGFVWSDRDYDPRWSTCQPYGNSYGIYSPGVCPGGHELKEVTRVIHDDGQGYIDTLYRGYCCQSCVSSFEPHVTARSAYLEMRRHEDDLSSFPEWIAACLRVGMGLPAFPATTTPVMPTEPSAAPIPSSDESQDSYAPIPRGGIIGVSIGVVIVVLLITTLGYLALSRRWKRMDAEQGKTPPTGYLRWIPWRKRDALPSLPEIDQGHNIHRLFSDGAWRAELHGAPSIKGGGLLVDPAKQHRFGSTVVVGPAVELEGSMPAYQEAPIGVSNERL
ncbi:hypothetical protein F4802DRAFT_610727 [Xylaria palmicola]|nr:hypothetical protein F4802DRAFT_610727 [Xylaria palmicola]